MAHPPRSEWGRRDRPRNHLRVPARPRRSVRAPTRSSPPRRRPHRAHQRVLRDSLFISRSRLARAGLLFQGRRAVGLRTTTTSGSSEALWLVREVARRAPSARRSMRLGSKATRCARAQLRAGDDLAVLLERHQRRRALRHRVRATSRKAEPAARRESGVSGADNTGARCCRWRGTVIAGCGALANGSTKTGSIVVSPRKMAAGVAAVGLARSPPGPPLASAFTSSAGAGKSAT